LVPLVDRALWRSKKDLPSFTPYVVATIGRVLAEIEAFDIVHAHLDYQGLLLARCTPRPVVTTLHGRLDLAELEPIFAEFLDVPLVSISDAQRKPAPKMNWAATIHHGITLDDFTLNPRPGNY